MQTMSEIVRTGKFRRVRTVLVDEGTRMTEAIETRRVISTKG